MSDITHQDLWRRLAEREAEIERLRAELFDPAYSRVLVKDLEDQNAEVERLKAALRAVEESGALARYADTAAKVRAALEGK